MKKIHISSLQPSELLYFPSSSIISVPIPPA